MLRKLSKPTILLVDDEPVNLRVLKQLLGQHYSLVFAKNGEEALRLASEQHPCLLYTSPSPRDLSTSRMPSSA